MAAGQRLSDEELCTLLNGATVTHVVLSARGGGEERLTLGLASGAIVIIAAPRLRIEALAP